MLRVRSTKEVVVGTSDVIFVLSETIGIVVDVSSNCPVVLEVVPPVRS